MRTPIPALAAAILLAGPTVLAFFSGGFFERPRLIAGVAAWVLVGVAALTSDRPLPRSTPGRLAIAGLVVLTAWVGLSYEWAPLGERAQGDVQRLLLYLGFFVAAIALLRGRAGQRFTEPALALGAFIVIAYGMADRLVPGLVEFTRSSSAEGRLEQPLTYWNATGALSAIGLVLCVRIAADDRRPRPLRAAAALLGPTLGLGVYLSFSRGALFALAGGLVLLVVLSPVRRPQLRALAIVVGAGVLAALVSSFLPAVESLPKGSPGDGGQGAVMLAVLAALSLAAALVTYRTRIEPQEGAGSTGRRSGRLRRPAVVAGATVLVLAGLATVAALEGSPTARPTDTATSAKRFGSADTLRYAYWKVAADSFLDAPLVGTGSGGFAVEWRRRPDSRETAVDAHSLYIETFAELGLVGVAFLALFLGAVLVCGLRLHRRDPATACGLAAALAVFAVHAGLDWDWEMPALTGVVLALAGAVVAAEDQSSA